MHRCRLLSSLYENVEKSKQTVYPKSDTGGEVTFHSRDLRHVSSEEAAFLTSPPSIQSGQEAFYGSINTQGQGLGALPRSLGHFNLAILLFLLTCYSLQN